MNIVESGEFLINPEEVATGVVAVELKSGIVSLSSLGQRLRSAKEAYNLATSEGATEDRRVTVIPIDEVDTFEDAITNLAEMYPYKIVRYLRARGPQELRGLRPAASMADHHKRLALTMRDTLRYPPKV